MSQVVKLLRDLIALPSVNNAFLPPGDPHAGEELVADYLKNRARKAGLEIETQATNSGRDNLIVRLKPLGQATHRIILAPHMDTVGGDLDKIKVVGKYLIEVWKAAGMDLSHVEFKWASEAITNQADKYWPQMLDVARRFNITRIK